MDVKSDIEIRLTAAFSPTRLEVLDESARHANHSAEAAAGQSHFRVRISSSDFKGMARLARHRAVHEALGRDLIDRIHMLALDISE